MSAKWRRPSARLRGRSTTRVQRPHGNRCACERASVRACVMSVHVHARVRAHAHAHVRAHIHALVEAHAHAHVHALVEAHVSVRMATHVFKHMSIHTSSMHMSMHTPTHMSCTCPRIDRCTRVFTAGPYSSPCTCTYAYPTEQARKRPFNLLALCSVAGCVAAGYTTCAQSTEYLALLAHDNINDKFKFRDCWHMCPVYQVSRIAGI